MAFRHQVICSSLTVFISTVIRSFARGTRDMLYKSAATTVTLQYKKRLLLLLTSTSLVAKVCAPLPHHRLLVRFARASRSCSPPTAPALSVSSLLTLSLRYTFVVFGPHHIAPLLSPIDLYILRKTDACMRSMCREFLVELDSSLRDDSMCGIHNSREEDKCGPCHVEWAGEVVSTSAGSMIVA